MKNTSPVSRIPGPPGHFLNDGDRAPMLAAIERHVAESKRQFLAIQPIEERINETPAELREAIKDTERFKKFLSEQGV
jgi:hypothetical protein